MKVSYEEFQEKDSDNNSLTDADISKSDKIMIYAHERLEKANFEINNITPKWVKNIYKSIADTLTEQQCDVIVFGNNRGITPDKLLTDVGTVLSIPTVVELSNLFMDPTLNPNIIVAPSTYSANHESIKELGVLFDIENTDVCSYDNSCINNYTKIVIIPPAVDTNKFSKKNVELYGGKINNPLCLDDCINIGFIARLAIEKNVGLFLMMSSILIKTHNNVRFTIIGDGPLRKDLTILTERLNLTNVVLFTGWVDEKLPYILNGIDIIINPSLRAWAETFCISNIEVMSMSIPIITFGVGGTGEYIDNPNNYNDDDSYTITSNSVVVHEATPMALYNATRILIMNSTLRQQLGEASRGIIISLYYNHYHYYYLYIIIETITKYFYLERQMNQYKHLYNYLHNKK